MKRNNRHIPRSRPLVRFNKKGQLVCWYCEELMTMISGPRKKTTDHIVPKHLFGSNHPANKLKACQDCNKEKNNFLPSQFAFNIRNIFLPNAQTIEEKLRWERIMQNCMNLGRYIANNKQVLFIIKTTL